MLYVVSKEEPRLAEAQRVGLGVHISHCRHADVARANTSSVRVHTKRSRHVACEFCDAVVGRRTGYDVEVKGGVNVEVLFAIGVLVDRAVGQMETEGVLSVYAFRGLCAVGEKLERGDGLICTVDLGNAWR